MRAPPSGMKDLAKAYLYTAIALDIRISTCKFCGTTNIQTIALTENKTKITNKSREILESFI